MVVVGGVVPGVAVGLLRFGGFRYEDYEDQQPRKESSSLLWWLWWWRYPQQKILPTLQTSSFFPSPFTQLNHQDMFISFQLHSQPQNQKPRNLSRNQSPNTENRDLVLGEHGYIYIYIHTHTSIPFHSTPREMIHRICQVNDPKI